MSLCVLLMVFSIFGIASAQFGFDFGNKESSPLDLLKERDENLVVLERDGYVTWLSGNLTDIVVKDDESADRALNELAPVLGADENTEFKRVFILEDDSNYDYYTYQQYFNSMSIIDSVVKLIVNPDGIAEAVSANVTPIDPEDYDFETTIDEGTALQIAMDAVKEEDPGNEYIFSENMDAAFLSIPVEGLDKNEAGTSVKAVYIFYSNNPDVSGSKYDMPFLAHYVTMNGVYAGSKPCTYPGDSDALNATEASAIFSHMTADTWTGTVTDHNGNGREITVPVMKDEDGVTWLGDPERKILVAECADLVQQKPVIESILNSERNETWPNRVLMAYENYIKVWDFYASLGWIGPDGEGNPMIIMNNYVDKDLDPVNNAVYMGYENGFHMFATSELNNYCECIDVIAHEYTHAVTAASMTMNLYINEMGAINEAMSDIMGNLIELSLGATDDTEWLLGENSGRAIRSMKAPHLFRQPEFVGDVYWVPASIGYNEMTDYGGVHFNSSLLNRIAYMLYEEGMSLKELVDLFSGVICSMIPTTANAEMTQILLFSARICGFEQYSDLIQKVCDEQGYSMHSNILLRVPEGYGRLIMSIPETDVYDMSDIRVTAIDMGKVFSDMFASDPDALAEMMSDADDDDMSRFEEILEKSAYFIWPDGETGHLVLTVPEGEYIVTIINTNEEAGEISAGWNGAQWVPASGSSNAAIRVESGCETWIYNAGLPEVLSGESD